MTEHLSAGAGEVRQISEASAVRGAGSVDLPKGEHRREQTVPSLVGADGDADVSHEEGLEVCFRNPDSDEQRSALCAGIL